MSIFVAGLRIVFATVGMAALLNLVTAYRLLTRPAALTALGQSQINVQVHVAIALVQRDVRRAASADLAGRMGRPAAGPTAEPGTFAILAARESERLG